MPSELIAAILDQLLFSSLLAAGVWAVCLSLGQRWPRFCYGLWMLVLVRLVLPPSLASSWSLRSLLEGLRSAPKGSAELSAVAPWEPLTGALESAQVHPSGEIGAVVVAVVWATVAASLLGLWLRAHGRLHRALRRSEEVTSAPLLAQVEQWRERLGIRRSVALRTGALSTGNPRTGNLSMGHLGMAPFTTGVLRPILYLPRPLLDAWRPEDVEPVVAHEMAHVARLDSLWIRVQAVLRAVYFFHPAAWLALAQVNRLREELCDRTVLEAGTMSPALYGRSLVAVLRLNLKGPAQAPAFHQDKRRLAMRLKKVMRFSPAPSGSGITSSGSSLKPLRPTGSGLTWSVLAVAGLLVLPMGQVRGERLAEPAGNQVETSAADHTLGSPLATSRISSAFGSRRHPVSGETTLHQGVDMVAASGTEVLAPAAGTVEVATEAYDEGAHWGTVVVLDHGNGVKTRYAHLGGLIAKPGATVEKGQAIAVVGSTGVSTGPHLHFEVWIHGEVVDPSRLVPGLAKG